MLDYKILSQCTGDSYNHEEQPSLPIIDSNAIMLEKLITLGKGASAVLLGSEETIKHAALLKAIKNSNKKAFTVDVDEIMSYGQIDDAKLGKVIRSATTVTVKEHLRIVEGEVTALSFDRVTLKTQDMESEFEIGIRMRKQFTEKRISVGDVIKIYKENCYVKRLGRASNIGKSAEFDMLPIVAIPEGECIKLEVVESEVTLDELDILNANDNGEEYLYTNCLTDEYIKEEVNKKVCKWIKESKAIVNTGVLIFDNCKNIEICSAISQHYKHIMFAPAFIFIFNAKTRDETTNSIKNSFFTLSFDDIPEIDLISYQMKLKNIRITSEDIKYLADLTKQFGFRSVNKIIQCSVTDQAFNRDVFIKLYNLYDFN